MDAGFSDISFNFVVFIC